MPSPTKPTDPVDWAETPPSPSDVTDPAALRAGGWVFESPLPYNFHNYLLRSLGRAATFLYALFSNAGDLTLGALYGYIRLTADPPNVGAGAFQTYTHVATGTGVASKWISDVVNGQESLVVGDQGVLSKAVDTVDVTVIDHVHSGSGVSEFRSGSFAPTDSVPGDVTLSRDTALYLNNLLKAVGSIEITFDGSGNPTPAVASGRGYNVTNPQNITAGGAFPLIGVTVDVVDDFTPRDIVCAVVPTSSGSTAFQWMAYVVPLVGPTTRFRIVLQVVVAGVWQDALDPAVSSSVTAGRTVLVTFTST